MWWDKLLSNVLGLIFLGWSEVYDFCLNKLIVSTSFLLLLVWHLLLVAMRLFLVAYCFY